MEPIKKETERETDRIVFGFLAASFSMSGRREKKGLKGKGVEMTKK